MRLRLLFVLPLVAVALAGSARPARGQSLADAARKEAERRKALKIPAKVISNKDLGPTLPSSSSGSSGSSGPSSGPADAAKPEPSQDAGDKTKDTDGADKAKDDPKKGEQYWGDRMKALQGALDHDQAFADALQVQINALTTDFANRDDPAQRSVIGQNRQKAIDELGRLTKAIADDKKAIVDFQEEARKAGVPPGWLR